MTDLLTAHNVSKSYGSFRALSDVSFSVGPGEFVAIIGPNGAGKTTLVNVVTGLLRPSKGEVRFKGRDIAAPAQWNWRVAGWREHFSWCRFFPR